MIEKVKNNGMQRILDYCITGYHEYLLGEKSVLTFASQNLCDMIQYSKEELINEAADLYAPLVHPADCRMYQRFLDEMRKEERTRTLEYRIVKRDGEIIHVADTMVSKRREDGRMAGYSTLADVTALREETENVRFINDTVPCGLLRYTCEKTPRITYVNDQLIKMMNIPSEKEEGLDLLELYKSSIYLAIAPESRNRFAQVLQQVYIQGTPYVGELNVLKGDGTKGRFFGWVTKCRTADGKDEFQSICMDITKRYKRNRSEQEKRNPGALTGMHDLVFAKHPSTDAPMVEIRTFGYFDVFTGGRPIMFKSEKAKELLAILVDRRGGYVTADEAVSLLWEDEPASPVVLARYRKVALRLKNTLEEYGVPELVESVSGKRRLATEYADCDLYRYLSSPKENASLFHGSYLTNYSWGEVTLGELISG